MRHRRFLTLFAIVALVAMAPADLTAQTLRERLQKARDARQSPDSEKTPSARGGRGLRAPLRQPSPPRVTPASESVVQWVAYLQRLQPKDAPAYADLTLEPFAQGVSAVEYWTAQLARFEDAERSDQALKVVEQLLLAYAGINRQLESALAQRNGFAAMPPDEKQREALTKYLWAASAYIDLAGRVRYTLFDALDYAALQLAERPADYDRLLDLLLREKSGIGAVVVSVGLLDPPRGEAGALAASPAAKAKTLRLIAASRNHELIPEVSRFVKQPGLAPRLLLAGADALRQIGLPQDERPGQDATLPKPPITARELAELLLKLDVRRLTDDERRLRDELQSWAAEHAKTGLAGDTYRLGPMEIHAGDWLLMRNPSPYNLFTDLSPGLFTHVGVAAIERGSDGLRRMVIVDIPENGPEMPATNVDAFVQRTRHFVFMRHPDAAVAAQMANAALATVGNVTQFDLNFRTDRVLALKGEPLAGKKIHTYCAGFLYLCALQTDLPREEFFPLREGPAPGYTSENLAKFGFTFGDDFISPTGAFFSPVLRLVGRREPMYDPGREIEEAVFDHFAQVLMTRQATPAPDTFQMLRSKVAEAAKTNPLLAKAVANAVGVDEEMDLVAAAKAKALVETLDEIAYGASGEFAQAREAVQTSDSATPPRLSPAQQSRLRELRSRHASLVQRWQKGELSPRALRVELVQHYIAEGKRRIEERFFGN